jgi:hypothetical protein
MNPYPKMADDPFVTGFENQPKVANEPFVTSFEIWNFLTLCSRMFQFTAHPLTLSRTLDAIYGSP